MFSFFHFIVDSLNVSLTLLDFMLYNTSDEELHVKSQMSLIY